MKHLLLTGFAILTGMIMMAQSGSARQVKWDFSARKVDAQTYELTMVANVSGDYHIYAQNAGVDGPVATSFNFNGNPLVTLQGKVEESGKLIKKFEKAWEGNVNFYEKKVEFVQQVKLKGKVKTSVNGKVEFMVCNDSQCLPPSEVEFKIPVGG